MNSNTEILKVFLKQSKRKQRKYTTLTSYLNVLEIFKKWIVVKDIIGKSNIKSTNLPRKLAVNKANVYNKRKIADAFNDFFTNIGQKLSSKIPKSSKTFKAYINKVNVIMESKPLLINELKDAFFSLKLNKRSGVDDVSFNIIKKCFGGFANP